MIAPHAGKQENYFSQIQSQKVDKFYLLMLFQVLKKYWNKVRISQLQNTFNKYI